MTLVWWEAFFLVEDATTRVQAKRFRQGTTVSRINFPLMWEKTECAQEEQRRESWLGERKMLTDGISFWKMMEWGRVKCMALKYVWGEGKPQMKVITSTLEHRDRSQEEHVTRVLKISNSWGGWWRGSWPETGLWGQTRVQRIFGPKG